MSDLSSAPSALPALFAHAVPVLLLGGAVIAGRTVISPAVAWGRARAVAGITLLAAAAALVAAVVAAGAWGTVQAVVLALIAFVGWVLTRFAGTYLAGEPDQPRFVRWLFVTLAGSTLVVATGNFGVLVVAWLGTSLALQNLLTFYAARPAAQMAAHKKFLVSRAADVCLLAAAALLAARFGTLHIDTLGEAFTTAGEPGAAACLAVVLIAVAALLKSAQLPFHGWLMQVMEAPTPVSALLHAGVVNLGGVVLIRLHEMVAVVPVAQAVLVVVGSLTAVGAALVATTRISIKVALAWSTCAQMGFMLLQCGLGLVEMALLHLVAHSLYKANAFLGAGTAVHDAVVAGLSPPARPAGVGARAAGLLAAVAVVWSACLASGVSLAAQPAVAAMGFVVALALVPLLAGDGGTGTVRTWCLRIAAPIAVVGAWFALHAALGAWLGVPAVQAPFAGALALWTAGCFLLLFAVQTLVAARPAAPAVQRLHAWCFGGLFLDEWFTRLTLRLWPIRVPAHRTPAAPLHLPGNEL